MIWGKRILTWGLLAFAGVSLIVFIVKEARRAGVEAEEALTGTKVVVFYFHGVKRCDTCQLMEALTRRTIDERFGDERIAGCIEFLIRNREMPVLVDIHDGLETRFRNLERVWELVDDEPAFMDYLGDELNAFVEGK